MHFSALVAITLSAVGVLAAPVVPRADSVAACCGVLSGNDVSNNEVLSGILSPNFDNIANGNGNGNGQVNGSGNGNGQVNDSGNGSANGNGSGNGNGSANPKDSGNGNDAGTANGNNPVGALGSILGLGKNN